MNTRLATESTAKGAADGELACAHCGQLAPRDVRAELGQAWFCCSGCQAVHAILVQARLTDYYSLRERSGERGTPARQEPAQAFAEFDTPAFQRLYCQSLDASVDRAELELGGLHCAACVWLVERLPRIEPAVQRARVDLGRGRLTLEFLARGPGSSPLSRLAATLAGLGYAPRPARGHAAERERRRELRGLLLRIGVAGASAGNVMLLAFALYGGADEISGLPETGTMAGATLRFLHGATWLVSMPALWAAASFFRGAIASLRTRTPHMDLPIALGILTAFIWGTVSILRGGEGIYFDTITILIFLLLIGRYLDVRHRQRQSQAAELLSAVLPGRARRLLAGSERDIESVPLDALSPGDCVLVSSGETVPVDGVVRFGESMLDVSLMSGESEPVLVRPGHAALAGALNVGGELGIEVEEAGAGTRVARLLESVERAVSERAPVLGLTNRMAGRFTWTVLACSLGVFLIWAPRSLEAGVSSALAVLIVACPCALAMATPLALTSAVAQAARAGILVFGAGSLERLAAPSLIVLDKTGTLTLGQLRVLNRAGTTELDPYVLAIEQRVLHPAGRALAQELARIGTKPSHEVEDAREILGSGITARVPNGTLLVGSAAFVLGHARPSSAVAAALETAPPAQSPVLVALNGTAQAVFFLADQIRSDAAQSLRRLHELGHSLCILSGDAEAPVAHVAATLAREADVQFECVLAGVSPEQKLARVQAWARQRPSVVMVGDGINDAGALSAAHVGVAVGGAAEAARLSADVYLSQSGALALASLMEGSRRTLRTIQRGVGFSLGYNALGIGLAAAGILNPLVAAIMMPLSSLTVVSHAFRSQSFRRCGAHRAEAP